MQSTLYTAKLGNINSKIKQLNEKLVGYADKNEIQFLNINSLLAPNEELLDKYTLDGIHLNLDAYIVWSNTLEKWLEKDSKVKRWF